MTCLFGEPAIEEFYNTASEIEDYSVKLARHVVAARAFNAALTPGRVVLINTPVRTTYNSHPPACVALCSRVIMTLSLRCMAVFNSVAGLSRDPRCGPSCLRHYRIGPLRALRSVRSRIPPLQRAGRHQPGRAAHRCRCWPASDRTDQRAAAEGRCLGGGGRRCGGDHNVRRTAGEGERRVPGAASKHRSAHDGH